MCKVLSASTQAEADAKAWDYRNTSQHLYIFIRCYEGTTITAITVAVTQLCNVLSSCTENNVEADDIGFDGVVLRVVKKPQEILGAVRMLQEKLSQHLGLSLKRQKPSNEWTVWGSSSLTVNCRIGLARTADLGKKLEHASKTPKTGH